MDTETLLWSAASNKRGWCLTLTTLFKCPSGRRQQSRITILLLSFSHRQQVAKLTDVALWNVRVLKLTICFSVAFMHWLVSESKPSLRTHANFVFHIDAGSRDCYPNTWIQIDLCLIIRGLVAKDASICSF